MNLYLNTFENVKNIPELFAYIFIFIIGAAIGSFLNVVIHRVPNEKSIIFPNSACPNCKKSIKPYDNIPILSWLILSGKCRSCKTPISPRYLFVELLTGLLFLLVYWSVGFSVFLPVALIFTAAIVSLVFIDAEHMILPNVITYPLLIFALLIRLIFPLLFGANYFSDFKNFPLNQMQDSSVWLVSLVGAILGALVGGGFLWLVGAIWKKLRGVDAMGLGDVKMMLAVGALLGWQLTLLSIFIGALTGAIIGIFVIARQKEKDFQTQIPFGIFLGIGSILSLLFGEQIIYWYMNNFLP
ncbi:MAG TPA: prepilin peptidase [Pyrinomonadaceae bacterium]|nr:prepilin peptidase [Pyrinomonadaceae bacterium]